MNNQLEMNVKRMKGKGDAQKAYCCMTEVPSPWPIALCNCRDWVTENLGTYVEGYHLETRQGEVVGHIYFALSEKALVPYEIEPGACVLYCEWVQKRYQGHGWGRYLFDSFLSEMKIERMKGILVEATDREGSMHFSHYTGRGFKKILEHNQYILLYLPIITEQVAVTPLDLKLKPEKKGPVEILILNGYMCPYEAATLIDVRAIVPEFGEQVNLRDVWLTPETLNQYGSAKGIFINGKRKLVGGESEQQIRQAIREEL